MISKFSTRLITLDHLIITPPFPLIGSVQGLIVVSFCFQIKFDILTLLTNMFHLKVTVFALEFLGTMNTENRFTSKAEVKSLRLFEIISTEIALSSFFVSGV